MEMPVPLVLLFSLTLLEKINRLEEKFIALSVFYHAPELRCTFSEKQPTSCCFAPYTVVLKSIIQEAFSLLYNTFIVSVLLSV